MATVPWMQTACNLLANHLRAKHPSWEEKLPGAGHKLAQLQAESRSLLKAPLLPFSFLQCFALTSLSQSLAGVIPTPAGIGSVEAVFTLLFRRLLPEAKALSAVLLYRFTTMLLPCAIGAFFVLGERIVYLHRKKRTAD